MVRWPLASVLSSFKCPLTGHISKSTFFPPEGNVTASFKGLPCGCGPWFPGTTSSQNPTHSPPRSPPFLGSLYALSHPFLKSPSCHGAPVCPWSHCGCWSLMLRVKGPVRSAKPRTQAWAAGRRARSFLFLDPHSCLSDSRDAPSPPPQGQHQTRCLWR